MKTATYALLICLAYASTLEAQLFDRWRERQLWLPAWLDDTPPKTWAWHAAIAVSVGAAIGWVTPLSVPEGMRFMVALYFVRELANRTTLRPLRFNWRYKPLDGVMDVVTPAIAVELVIRL